MRSVDPWPAAAVLRRLPPVARLRTDFDVEAMRSDLDLLESRTWSKIRIMTGDGLGAAATNSDWRTIPLRSIGGQASRTDPGGPDLADFADTPRLDHLPYFQQAIGSLPHPVRSARLMALGPGARSPLHSDTKLGLPWGVVRLHVPVVTVPEATLSFGDKHYCWPAGQLWYADFTRGHTVQNTGALTRVHLVVDVEVSDSLIGLFPPPFIERENIKEYLFPLPPIPLTRGPAELECDFAAPTSFLSWEALDDVFLEDASRTPVSIRQVAGELVVFVGGKPRFGLVHVGSDEFRWAGWTTERSIQMCLYEATPHVVLRTRRGSQAWSLVAEARRAAEVAGDMLLAPQQAGIDQ